MVLALTGRSGGGNGMCVFGTGVHYDLPVVDGDGMGRAYPTIYHGKYCPRSAARLDTDYDNSHL